MNLLDDDILCEMTIVIPKVGQAQYFATKQDRADPEYVSRVAQETINAAVNFARAYNMQINATVGQGGTPP
jgi:hypothetical protein